MKGLRIVGDYALEFLTVTLLLAVSALLVIPFIPMVTGVTAFFSQDIDTRRFKDIFTAIGKNIKIIIFYTLFQLVIIIFPVLNIYFFNTHPQNTNYFVLAISCIALTAGIIYLVTAPTVIVNMRVTLRQLLYNGIMLLFGGLWRSLIALACSAVVVALILFYPFALIAVPYFYVFIVSRVMNENFLRLKAKAVGKSVFELKNNDKDDYLDENGEINREEEVLENE